MNGQDWHDQRCRCNEGVCEMQPGHKAVFSTSSMNREVSRSPRDLVATSMDLNAFRSKNVILEHFKTWQWFPTATVRHRFWRSEV